MFELYIHNSFCSFSENIPTTVLDTVRYVLTYKNDIDAEKGYCFKLIKYHNSQIRSNRTSDEEKEKHRTKLKQASDRLKKLEQTEWVCWLNGLEFPTGHLNIIKDILDSLNVQYKIVDYRTAPTNDHIIRWVNKPWDPRYYQKDMIDLGLLHHRGVFESAVGTGKTLIMAYLLKELAVTSLIVVPSRGLKEQIYRDLKKWFGVKNVQQIDTAAVRKGKQLKPFRICTVQTLTSLQKTGDLGKLVDDVNAIFVDEIHHAGSESYTKLMRDINHVYYRFGFTGTFLRNDSKTLDMWGFLSTKLYTYKAKQAIEDGYLTPIEVLIHSLKGKKSTKYKTEYNKNYCKNINLLTSIHYTIENQISDNDQILILVNRKDDSGKIIHEYLEAVGFANTYISGDDKADKINDAIENFNTKDIRILIGSSVIGEGINVESADHLFMCQGNKSPIAIVQAVGRLARLFEGKKIGYLHDFNFTNTKYMSQHLAQRIELYEDNFEPTIREAV